MTVRVEEYDLGGDPLWGYCVFTAGFAALAISPDLPPAIKRARELQGYGDWIKPPPTEDRAHLAAHDVDQVEYAAVRAISRVVDDLEPGWVQCVKEECRVTNDARIIADRCGGLDLTAVLAIIRNLKVRGELPSAPEG